jgi:hypothetical protein
MKRYILTIGLLAACLALPGVANAQWSFTATLTTSGNCGGVSKPYLPAITGFATKAECDMVRNQILNIRVSGSGCTVSYRCTACTGRDIVMPGQTTTNTVVSGNTSGTVQGTSVQTANPGQAIPDAMEQYKLFTEAVLKKGKRLYYGDGPMPTRPVYDDARTSLARATANTDGKNFEWHGGRGGAIGGFNMRPNADAARYNEIFGSQMFAVPVGSIENQRPTYISGRTPEGGQPRTNYEDHTVLENTENAVGKLRRGENLDAAVDAGNAYLGKDGNFNILGSNARQIRAKLEEEVYVQSLKSEAEINAYYDNKFAQVRQELNLIDVKDKNNKRIPTDSKTWQQVVAKKNAVESIGKKCNNCDRYLKEIDAVAAKAKEVLEDKNRAISNFRDKQKRK